MITNLNVLDEFTSGYDDTSTFVSTDQREFCCQWPVTVDSVEISVADTRVLNVDENFIWAGLCNWDLLVDDSYEELGPLNELKSGQVRLTPSGLLDNLCPLLSWDLWG
jgi:hypothetical protein